MLPLDQYGSIMRCEIHPTYYPFDVKDPFFKNKTLRDTVNILHLIPINHIEGRLGSRFFSCLSFFMIFLSAATLSSKLLNGNISSRKKKKKKKADTITQHVTTHGYKLHIFWAYFYQHMLKLLPLLLLTCLAEFFCLFDEFVTYFWPLVQTTHTKWVGRGQRKINCAASINHIYQSMRSSRGFCKKITMTIFAFKLTNCCIHHLSKQNYPQLFFNMIGL